MPGSPTTGEVLALAEVTLLAPCEPSKIVAMGLNYRDHAAEFGHPVPDEPLIFLKPSTAVIGPDEDIVYPEMTRRVDYEAELAVVMGKTAHRVPEDQASWNTSWATPASTTSPPGICKKKTASSPGPRASTPLRPLGPWIETEIGDPDNLTVEAYLNGERRQHGSTSNMVFGVAASDRFHLRK